LAQLFWFDKHFFALLNLIKSYMHSLFFTSFTFIFFKI
jgi:hypothetical protein